MAQLVKNMPANAGDARDGGLILRLGLSHGEGNGNPFSILAWKIPWTEETGGLSLWGRKELDMIESACMHAHTHTIYAIMPKHEVIHTINVLYTFQLHIL